MEPHSRWIEDLLRNNHSPSDEAVQEVKGFLVKPLKDLEDLDAEILNLKNRLSELESKREETQKRISQYRSILAPIRRIPPDVLGEIFLRCLPTNRNPIMKSTECPLLLTRVCSPWRAVAMSSPRLWERIYVTFTDDDTVPDLESAAEMVRNGRISVHAGWQSAQSKSEKQCTTDILRDKYEAVREWLMRSGTRPLSISLSFPSTYWYNVPYSERPPSVTMEFLSFLATLAPRLRNLELKISPEIYQVLEQMVKVVSDSEMTVLASLRIEYPVQFPVHREASRRPMLFHAPHLQHLSIATGGDFRILDIDSSIRWNQLTTISCFDALTITQTTVLLHRSSNLIHYRGVISEYLNVDTDTPFLYEGCISLPFLQSLSITQYATPGHLGNMYHRIDAPSLQSVDFAFEFHVHPGELSTDTTGVVSSILPLLHKATELQKFSFDTNQPTPGDIATLLGAVPTITHLVIGTLEKDLSRRNSFPVPLIGYSMSGLPYRDTWGFENLIVCGYSKDDKSTLLPRLTSLVISTPNAPISDDTLLDLIKSRMVPGQTAALKHVKLVSPRKREKNIEGELTGYAKLVGGDIKLDLNYAQPPVPKTKRISPDFGLNESGRSWRYIDAGEDL